MTTLERDCLRLAHGDTAAAAVLVATCRAVEELVALFPELGAWLATPGALARAIDELPPPVPAVEAAAELRECARRVRVFAPFALPPAGRNIPDGHGPTLFGWALLDFGEALTCLVDAATEGYLDALVDAHDALTTANAVADAWETWEARRLARVARRRGNRPCDRC